MEFFEHYVLTKFNTDTGLDTTNKRNSPEYLKQRFAIFESITIPSIVSQTEQNFLWLVFFDSDTPNEFKERVQDILQFNNCQAVYVQKAEQIIPFLKEKLSPNTKTLVTTNLDNDDALHKKFVEIIHSNFRDEKLYFLNFTLGYMLRKDGLYMREYLSSPFHTVVETVGDDLLTCLNLPHYYVYFLSSQGVPVYQIASQPAWLQIIHGTNVVNRWDRNAVLVSDINRVKDFGIDISSPYFKEFYTGNSTQLKFCRYLINDKTKSYKDRVKLIIYTLLPFLALLNQKLKSLLNPQRKQLQQYSSSDIRNLITKVN